MKSTVAVINILRVIFVLNIWMRVTCGRESGVTLLYILINWSFTLTCQMFCACTGTLFYLETAGCLPYISVAQSSDYPMHSGTEAGSDNQQMSNKMAAYAVLTYFLHIS
jgi:hypothetical protein